MPKVSSRLRYLSWSHFEKSLVLSITLVNWRAALQYGQSVNASDQTLGVAFFVILYTLGDLSVVVVNDRHVMWGIKGLSTF